MRFVWQRPYGVVAVAYGLLVLWMATQDRLHDLPSCSYTAGQDLVRNHRVQPGDLVKSAGFSCSLGFYLPPQGDLVGSFVASEKILKKEVVSISNVRTSPLLVPPAGSRLILYSLEGESRLARLLDVGRDVALHHTDAAADQSASFSALVFAVVCEQSDNNMEHCHAILQVSEADEPKISLNNKAGFFRLLPNGIPEKGDK